MKIDGKRTYPYVFKVVRKLSEYTTHEYTPHQHWDQTQ